MIHNQRALPVVLMRGGTSKGVYIHDRHLPPPGEARDRVLIRLMGSPDVLQIDGLGGSRPVTSKIAIIGKPSREDADVDYTFAQVDIETATIIYSGNCGNISAGVGPFAIDERIVEPSEGVTTVRIHNTNTGKLITAHVPVHEGFAAVEGDCAIPGVPGTGAEIRMDWAATVGAKSGSLLPTGHAVDNVRLPDGRTVEVSLIDIANPVAWISHETLGHDLIDSPEDVLKQPALLKTASHIRGWAAVELGMCDDPAEVDNQSPGLPLIGVVSSPRSYSTLNGQHVREAAQDVTVRLLFMNRLHESIAGAAAISVAAASLVPGSVVARCAQPAQHEDQLLIGHPSGVMRTFVVARHDDDGTVAFDTVGFSRTARRLMDGVAYYPERG